MITMFMTRWYPCRARSGDPSEGDHQRDEHPQGEAEADEVQATRPAGADAEGGHQETEKSGQIDHSSTYYLAPCCRIPRVIVWQRGLECVQEGRDRLALDLAGPERPINRGSERRRCRWNAFGEPLASLAAGDINRALAAIVLTGDQGQANSSTSNSSDRSPPREHSMPYGQHDPEASNPPAGATVGARSLVVASAPTWRRSRASSAASARMRSSATVSALTTSTAAGDDGERIWSQSRSACTHSCSSSPGAVNTCSQSATNALVQRTSANSTADRNETDLPSRRAKPCKLNPDRPRNCRNVKPKR